MRNLSLSLKEKIGQLMMIGFQGTESPDSLFKLMETHHIGYFILFSRNISSIPQVIELNERLHSLGKVPPLIFTDQEGGNIVRFGEMAATMVSPMGITATGDPGNAESAGRIIGQDMNTCGIDGVFAPLLDVNIEEDNPVIGIRSFSDQPDTVVEYAERFCLGLHDSGILACGKHYPGHGAAKADSHLEIPIINLSEQDFQEYCFAPFEAMAEQSIDSMMTSHVLFPELSKDIATFSTKLIQELLREQTGYNGVVFTDCLEMKAIADHYSPEQIALNGIKAGNDVLVVSHHIDLQIELMDILLFYAKKGVIEEKRIDESLTRIFALKSKRFPDLSRQIDKSAPERKDLLLRKNIATEKEIAEKSITLLKNKKGILPLDKNKKTLILEWHRQIKGPSVAENENQSTVEKISNHFLNNRDILRLNPNEPIPQNLSIKLKAYEYIIVFIYSRTGRIDHLQTEAIKKLYTMRKDIIVVSLENPYEIKKFPFIDTYLLTYGYRQIQLEALFKILTGEILPSGKLPVNISNLYSRGFGLEDFSSNNIISL